MTESWNITYTEIIYIQEVYKASGLHLGSLILDAKSKEVFPFLPWMYNHRTIQQTNKQQQKNQKRKS